MRLRRIAHGINLTENILAFDGPVSREQIKPPGKLSAAMARIKAGRSRQLPRACTTPTCRPLWVRRSRSRTPTDSDRQVTLLSCPSIPGSLPLDHPINGQAALARAVHVRRSSPIAEPASGRCSQGGSKDSSRRRVRARRDVVTCSGSSAEARQLVQGGDHRNVGVDVRPTAADGAVLQPDRPHSDIA